jgi:hypothetical protein
LLKKILNYCIKLVPLTVDHAPVVNEAPVAVFEVV